MGFDFILTGRHRSIILVSEENVCSAEEMNKTQYSFIVILNRITESNSTNNLELFRGSLFCV